MTDSESGPWAQEATDVVRAIAGGLLFGVPLIFTMEMWWLGTTTEPLPMVAVLALTFGALLLLNRTSGFRSTKDVRLVDSAIDAVEAVALAVLIAWVLLFALQEIRFDTPLREMLGKVVYEAMPIGIGIALASHFLRQDRTAEDDGGESTDGGEQKVPATVADLAATVIGSVFVAFNIAPTDEIPMVAARMVTPALVGVVALSLVVSFLVVFVAGFTDQEGRQRQQGAFQHPLAETVAAYLVSLVCGALMLWFFQRLDLGAPLGETLSHVIVLGLPAAVGGAAGRLAV